MLLRYIINTIKCYVDGFFPVLFRAGSFMMGRERGREREGLWFLGIGFWVLGVGEGREEGRLVFLGVGERRRGGREEGRRGIPPLFSFVLFPSALYTAVSDCWTRHLQAHYSPQTPPSHSSKHTNDNVTHSISSIPVIAISNRFATSNSPPPASSSSAATHISTQPSIWAWRKSSSHPNSSPSRST